MMPSRSRWSTMLQASMLADLVIGESVERIADKAMLHLATPGIPPQRKYPGSQSCGCGRTISGNKDLCAECAGLKAVTR